METIKTRLLSNERAVRMGYSSDKRKRKNQHREMARQLLGEQGFFARGADRGTTMNSIAVWHLTQARMLAQA